MAAGLKYCDRALTVSPSYAVECCTDPEKGGSLMGVWGFRDASIAKWEIGTVLVISCVDMADADSPGFFWWIPRCYEDHDLDGGWVP